MIININMDMNVSGPPAACIKQGWAAGYSVLTPARWPCVGSIWIELDPGERLAQRARVPKPLIDKVGTMK